MEDIGENLIKKIKKKYDYMIQVVIIYSTIYLITSNFNLFIKRAKCAHLFFMSVKYHLVV